MSESVVMSQENFLRGGGMYQMPMAMLRKRGELPGSYTYQEYPRAIVIVKGPPREVERSAETCDKKTITWKEMVPNQETIIVRSEEEEERVLAGGKTSAQLEEDRLALINRCRANGINVDIGWSNVRLRRELGDALDAPVPGDEMAALKAKMERLEEMAAMKARIAQLEAQLAAPAHVPATEMDDPDELRGQLAALGVSVDRRWGQARLREELERATAPKAA